MQPSKLLYHSLHRELASNACEDLVGHDDFLSTAPPVLVAPNVTPSEEVGHRDHGASESPNERLSLDHGEEEVSSAGGNHAILEASELVLGHPGVAVLQVLL